MFKGLKTQIDQLDEKKSYLNAEFDGTENRSLLDFYVKIMPKVLDAERCSIFVYDPENKTIWLKGGTGVHERDIEVSPESVVGEVITSGQYKIVSGLDEKSGVHKKVDEKTGFITRNILCTPVLSLDGKRVTGAVEVLNKTGGKEFSDEDRIMLDELAHFLQLTIENIFYNQESTLVMNDLYSTMKRSVFIAVVVVVFLVIYIAVF